MISTIKVNLLFEMLSDGFLFNWRGWYIVGWTFYQSLVPIRTKNTIQNRQSRRRYLNYCTVQFIPIMIYCTSDYIRLNSLICQHFESTGRFAVMICVLIISLIFTLFAIGLGIYGMLFVSGFLNRLFYYHSATEILLVACTQTKFLWC